MVLKKFHQRLPRILLPLLAVTLICVSPAVLASSWSPTLLVNTESFEMIDAGNWSTTVDMRFGSTTNTLKLLTTNVFQFSKKLSVLGTISGSSLNVDQNATVGGTLTVTGAVTAVGAATVKGTLSGKTLRVSGNADVNGILSVTGAVHFDANLSINDDADSNDVVLTFGNSIGNQSLKFLHSGQKFQFSKTLSILGTISGSALNVDRNATVGGTLTVTGAVKTLGNLTIIGTLSGNIIHAEKTLTSSGLLMVRQSTIRGSGALVVDQVRNATGAYLRGSGSHITNPLLALDSSTGSVKAPHILFGYKGTFDISLYRATGAILKTNATSLTVSGNLSGKTLNIGGSGIVPNSALCFKSTGRIGYCSTAVGAGGTCTCN